MAQAYDIITVIFCHVHRTVICLVDYTVGVCGMVRVIHPPRCMIDNRSRPTINVTD